MAALGACLAASSEERLALVASSPDPLARLLVNEILSSGLAGALEDNVFCILGVVRVVGNDGCVLLLSLENGGPLLPAGDALGLGSLGRVADALGATNVLAARALFGGSKGSIALVAGSVDAHANGLLDAESSALSRDPLALLDLETESLAQLPGALFEELGSGNPGDALEVLVLALRGLLLGGILGGLLGGGGSSSGRLLGRSGGGGWAVCTLDR